MFAHETKDTATSIRSASNGPYRIALWSAACSRLAAFALDFLIVGLLFIPLATIYQHLLARRRGTEPHVNVHFDFHDLHNLVFLVLYFGLVVYWSNGQTVGKRLLRIRIVSLVHERLRCGKPSSAL